MSKNWLDEREEWEGDRALYELELQKEFRKASNKRSRYLMGALACHTITAILILGWQIYVGLVLVIAAATLLLLLHNIENAAGRLEIKQKVELKFPENATPRPPEV